MGKTIGIDLGTTNTAAAYLNKHGKPEIIANREGQRTTPSVVSFEADETMVGDIAKRSAVASPLDTVQYVKRQMGNPNWSFETETGKSYTPEEVSAIILKRIAEDAETILGERVTDAVITVPAYFDDAQRNATKDAGEIAGLNVLRIINEPTAAALAYGIDKLDNKQTLLVYDLGGGTFDVTIVRLDGDEIKVLATGGDRNLGGFDFDNELMKHLNQEFKLAGGCDLFADPTLEQDLRDKVEIAKKTLSSRDRTKIFLSAGGKNVPVTLTLEKFQSLTQTLIETTGDIMELVLEEAGLSWKAIDKILLVGGSTRMRAVPTLIERLSGKKPSQEVHPDEAVALGAAIQAGLLQTAAGNTDLVECEALPKIEVKDINSHSMGIIAVEKHDHSIEYNAIVLKKNTPIPCKVSDTFRTIEEYQQRLLVQVTEGEDRDPRYVKVVGEGTMELPPYPKGSPMDVVFEYDSNGIIHVTVYDLVPKPKKKLGELHIKRTSNLDEEEVKEKRQKLSGLAIN